MANTKVTKAVLADDAVGLAQLDITNDPSNGQALTYVATSNDLQWATISGGVDGISSSADANAIFITSAEKIGLGATPDLGANVHIKTADSGVSAVNGNADDLVIENADYTGISILGENETSIFFGDNEDSDVGRIEYFHSTNSMSFRTNASDAMTITSEGKVGINTTSPSGKLTNYTSANRQQSFQGANGDLEVISDNNSAPVVYIKGTGTADLLNVFDNTTEVFSIQDGGQVLINGANASYPNDTATYGGAAANVIIKGENTATTDNAMFIYGGRLCLNAHPDRYNMRSYIQSDGAGLKVWHTDNSDFIVGVNNAEKFRVQYSDGIIKCFGIYAHAVSGTTRDVYIEDGGQMGYGSSVRAHKTNIVDYNDASWLYNLNPKQFNRRKKNMVIETNDDGVDHEVHDGTYSDTEYWDTVEVGFIAEDVEALDSKLCFYDVVTDEDGNESEQLAGIHYKAMVAPMLKLIQEQKTLIDDLTARIETLESN